MTMIVDNESSAAVFDKFKESLSRCDFYAADQEMTGVDCVDQPQLWSMTLEELYPISREAVSRYIAFQFGIALFTLVKDNVYEVNAYNFYLRKNTGDFTVNASSMLFLSSHRMDFQRWLVKGLPYYRRNEEDTPRQTQSTAQYTDIEQKIATQLVTKVESLYHTTLDASQSTFSLETILTKNVEMTTLLKLREIGVFVSFEGKRHPHIYTQPSSVTVSRITKDKFEKQMNQLRVDSSADSVKALGFQQIWKCLAESKKTMVGHNFWLDIMFMLHMHEKPLPPSYEEYKKTVQKLFPAIYDTKTLSSAIQIPYMTGSSNLQDLFQACIKLNAKMKKKLEFFVQSGSQKYSINSSKMKIKAHDAAYDACMTGVAFAIIKDAYKNDKQFKLTGWKNIISAYGSHFFMAIEGEDILKSKATFLLEFDMNVDEWFVKALLTTKESVEDTESDTKCSLSNCHVASDGRERCGKRIVVKFQDETVSESTIRTQIDLSMKWLHEWWTQTASLPEEIPIAQVVRIKRFLL